MAADEEWFDDDAGPVVRPYAVTGGRTRPADASLELVALVSTTAHGSWLAPRLDPEKQAIAALCREIQSIAEISARLGLPLGWPGCWSATWSTRDSFSSTGPPGPASVPT